MMLYAVVKPNTVRQEWHAATCTCIKHHWATKGLWYSLSVTIAVNSTITPPLLHLASFLFYMLRRVVPLKPTLSFSLSHPASWQLDCCSPPPSLHARLKAGSRCFVTWRSESLREMEPPWARLCRRRRESLHFHFQSAFSLLQERALIPPPEQHHQQYTTTACVLSILYAPTGWVRDLFFCSFFFSEHGSHLLLGKGAAREKANVGAHMHELA